MKIGIFGGSFNPPHKRHKLIALNLLEDGYIDKAIYVPTGNSYEKDDLVDFNHRVNMLKLMWKANPNVEVSLIGNLDDYQYTYQTLDKLGEDHKDDELYFICGEDNLRELDTWKRYTYILENYKILAIKRYGEDISDILEKYKPYIHNIVVPKMKTDTLSSTKIRNLLKESDRDEVSNYLDKDVYEYIVKEKLYEEDV